MQLSGDLLVANQRPGDELREHGDVQDHIADAALGPHVAAIDVDQVRERVEGVEGDAERQAEGESGGEFRRQAGDRRQGLDHEAAVLEQQQRDQVEDDAGGDPRPGPAGGAGLLDLQPEHVVRGDRRKQQHDEDRLAPGIENDAERRQSPFAAARRVEDQEEQRQEVEQESDAAEHHAWSAPWPAAGNAREPAEDLSGAARANGAPLSPNRRGGQSQPRRTAPVPGAGPSAPRQAESLTRLACGEKAAASFVRQAGSATRHASLAASSKSGWLGRGPSSDRLARALR